MKNKIKILGLAGLLVLTPVQIRATELPERFRNYTERATLTDTRPLQTPMGFFCVHRYDLDGDELADVMEMYPAIQGMGHLTEFPVSYWFDLNGDKKITTDEVLVDEAGDGINGNEYWEKPEPKPKPELHKEQRGI